MSSVRNKSNLTKKKGFSLGELILAIFVLLVGIVGVIGLVNNSIVHSTDSRDAIIASGLAQEGVELVRYIRDNNWVNPTADVTTFDQLYFPPYTTTNVYNCAVDKQIAYGTTSLYPASSGSYCNNPSSYALNYASGYYVHSAGTATKFQRKITLQYDKINDPDYMTVKSYVMWKSDNFPTTDSECSIGSKCIFVEYVLYRKGLNL